MFAYAIAKILSQYRCVAIEMGILKFWRRWHNYRISDMAAVRPRYSASMDERATIICLLVFQEIRLGLRKNQYLIIDFRSDVLLAQSEHEYACRCNNPSFIIRSRSNIPLMYQRTCLSY